MLERESVRSGTAARPTAIVVGGGVIGVCSAYYLARDGWEVTLLEKGEIASGCSYGNGGLIVPSHAVPLAAPGVWKKGLRFLLRRDAPFRIKPRLDLELASWLFRFHRSCTPEHTARSLPLLRDLGFKSLRLYEEMARLPGLDFGFRQDGLLYVYRSPKAFDEARQEAKLLDGAGIGSRILDDRETLAFEPNLLPGAVGGVLFPDDAQIVPDAFVRGLARVAEGLGVRVLTGTEVLGLQASGSRVTGVRTKDGRFGADEVVIATGSWSAGLTRDLGLRLPVQPGKGCSITFDRARPVPRLPLLLAEVRVFLTPLGNERLRIGGTLELSGLDLSVDSRRVDAILRGARQYLREVPSPSEGRPPWAGLRPCTPDGLPLLGRPGRFENLILATGHAMVGISLGPITGHLVAELACRRQPSIPLEALHPDRFA